jgi:hypothetical protein
MTALSSQDAEGQIIILRSKYLTKRPMMTGRTSRPCSAFMHFGQVSPSFLSCCRTQLSRGSNCYSFSPVLLLLVQQEDQNNDWHRAIGRSIVTSRVYHHLVLHSSEYNPEKKDPSSKKVKRAGFARCFVLVSILLVLSFWPYNWRYPFYVRDSFRCRSTLHRSGGSRYSVNVPSRRLW